jgi:hypothetical protein
MLDERVIRPSIRQLLPSYYQKEMRPVKNSAECGESIMAFWEKHPNLF